MAKNKHLTLSERNQIENLLTQRISFKAIGLELEKDCTTISKEIKNHKTFHKTGCFGRAFNNCLNRKDCSIRGLCVNNNCKSKLCSFCSNCHINCSYYEKETCNLLLKPPYVCNGCVKKSKCTLEKQLYSSSYSDNEYKTTFSESRSGFALSQEDVSFLDSVISPLILKGQSIHHICFNNKNTIMYSPKAIYNYIDAGILSARNIDLVRKVRYRKRKSKHDTFKVDKACRTNRTYEDYLKFKSANPNAFLVEIDTVEGVKGGKVLLTIHFVESKFMLAFLRDFNTAASVNDTFEKLYWVLGPVTFSNLFFMCLCDNGSEFSNPKAIEFDSQGNKRANLFYCNPRSPEQRGAEENNHELIRMCIPKGDSMNHLRQAHIQNMMNNINCYCRKESCYLTPYEMFGRLYGFDVLEKLNTIYIPPNEVTLKPSVLK